MSDEEYAEELLNEIFSRTEAFYLACGEEDPGEESKEKFRQEQLMPITRILGPLTESIEARAA